MKKNLNTTSTPYNSSSPLLGRGVGGEEHYERNTLS